MYVLVEEMKVVFCRSEHGLKSFIECMRKLPRTHMRSYYCTEKICNDQTLASGNSSGFHNGDTIECLSCSQFSVLVENTITLRCRGDVQVGGVKTL